MFLIYSQSATITVILMRQLSDTGTQALWSTHTCRQKHGLLSKAPSASTSTHGHKPSLHQSNPVLSPISTLSLSLTHTNTVSHASAHAHTHTHTQSLSLSHTHTLSLHTHTLSLSLTHTLSLSHTHSLSLFFSSHTHPHTQTQTHRHIHWQTQIPTQTHTLRHPLTDTPTHKHRHWHTYRCRQHHVNPAPTLYSKLETPRYRTSRMRPRRFMGRSFHHWRRNDCSEFFSTHRKHISRFRVASGLMGLLRSC